MRHETHKKLIEQALALPDVKKAYDDLEEEFSLLREVVMIRHASGKTQEDVAKAMGTTTSVVGRLETGGGKLNHSPTLATLRRYAQALGYSLQLRFVPHR